jgi:hypothetical protein
VSRDSSPAYVEAPQRTCRPRSADAQDAHAGLDDHERATRREHAPPSPAASPQQAAAAPPGLPPQQLDAIGPRNLPPRRALHFE